MLAQCYFIDSKQVSNTAIASTRQRETIDFSQVLHGENCEAYLAILRLPAVKAERGERSDTSVYNAIREGLFTKPVKLGARASGWPRSEVEAINAARIAGKLDAEIRELVERLHAKRTELFDALQS